MWPRRRQEPSAIPTPGDLIAGKYRVERVLGVGGMGYVLAARHTKLDELVAIKMLRGDVLRSHDDVARFLREGRACSKLKSEHVVRILDLGEVDGAIPYLVMEQLEGRDLAAVLRDHGTLSVPQTIECVLEACEAVAEAHALGIIHRDLKPANLFLARTPRGVGSVKVLDFGISKIIEEAADGDLSLTATRTLMGSPLYMAPEVMRSARAADLRSDIWALGCILYELLTGVTPWQGETVTELCVRVLEETPRPIARFRDDVPEGLEAVVLRCLAKRPEDRFQTVLDLSTALASFAGKNGADRLLGIERVVLAAEERQRRGRAAGSLPLASTDRTAAENAETVSAGEGTLRAFGTTKHVGGRRSRAVALVIAGVLTLGALALILVLGRGGREHSATSAAAPGPLPLPSVSTSPTASASAKTTVSASASEDLVEIKPSAKPTAKPTKPGTKATGHPTKSSPYFDDPN